MVTVSLQDQSRQTGAAPFACRPIRPGGKIAHQLEGIRAEHIVVSLAELWGLPVGEESMETVANKV
jgi:hypothetical protein